MRLTVLCSGHGKTKKDRFGFGGSGPTGSRTHGRHPRIAHGSSYPVARLGPHDVEGCRQGAWGWACHRSSPPSPIPAKEARRSGTNSPVGRAAAGAHEIGGGAGLFGGVEAKGRTRRIGGGDAAAGCAGTKGRPQAQAVGGVSPAGATPLAQ